MRFMSIKNGEVKKKKYTSASEYNPSLMLTGTSTYKKKYEWCYSHCLCKVIFTVAPKFGFTNSD